MVKVGITDTKSGTDAVSHFAHWLADVNLQSLEHSLTTMAITGVYTIVVAESVMVCVASMTPSH